MVVGECIDTLALSLLFSVFIPSLLAPLGVVNKYAWSLTRFAEQMFALFSLVSLVLFVVCGNRRAERMPSCRLTYSVIAYSYY